MTIMEIRNPHKFSTTVVDMDINKMLNEEYGVSYNITPSAQVYENGNVTYTMAGKAQMNEFSKKLISLTR